MANHDPKDPNATPDFDEWGWDDYWSLNDWLTWHKTLKEFFGVTEGNDRFVAAWQSRPINSWLGFGDVRGDWLAFNQSFRQYLASHKTSAGITMLEAITDPLTELVAKPVEIVGGLGDSVGNVGASIDNITKTAQSTTKTLQYLLPVLLITLAALAVYIIYKSYPLLISKIT